MDVRKAAASDIEATVDLAERNRRQYQKYQPTFWRKHPQSAAMTQLFFTKLLTEPGTFFLVEVTTPAGCNSVVSNETTVTVNATPVELQTIGIE